ncbi:uncharacterized protein LOC128962692 [Oppia nitens]|uniref:uncharacterized protein LOC128962692 n=1 Tax=Oppia nitens TaxID=1686743 RepID=UPI0023DBD189|nr:uncharacterized protein LOC128962692 [Oppia nitens]
MYQKLLLLLLITIFTIILSKCKALDLSDCPHECNSIKSNNSQPICASNGNTYESICEMKKSNCSLTQEDWEHCRGRHPLCPSDCLDIQDPVCAEDGKFYPNKCVLHKRNCGKKIAERSPLFCFGRNRQGRKYESCPKTCLEFPKPVCGSDGQIYLNECQLRQRNCGTDVKIVAMNECVKTGSCPDQCLAIYDPVCGSDGKIYLNHCKMLRENCETGIKQMPLQFCVGDDEQKI